MKLVKISIVMQKCRCVMGLKEAIEACDKDVLYEKATKSTFDAVLNQTGFIGTLTMEGKTFKVYLGHVDSIPVGNTVKHKFTLIEM